MPDPDAFVTLTVELPGKTSLAAAARRLRIATQHIDAGYGVVPLDPDNALYTVRVRASAAADTGATPFSDPKIRPFG